MRIAAVEAFNAVEKSLKGAKNPTFSVLEREEKHNGYIGRGREAGRDTTEAALPS